MRLTVFNGSPKGMGSNTKILLDHFLNGFTAGGNHSHEVVYLSRGKNSELPLKKFGEAQTVLLAFPLYYDSMPGLVKDFIESLKPLCGREENPDLGFLVQSGFPEAIHSRYVERYLEKLSRRLGCRYLGTMVKGGVEGIRVMPSRMTKKLFGRFYELGKTLGEHGRFEEKALRTLAGPEKYSQPSLLRLRLLNKTGLASFYWDMKLKQNAAYKKRFARPYDSKEAVKMTVE